MTPYITIHKAPFKDIIHGIVNDIPRYYGEKVIITTRVACGRGFTPRALKSKADIIKIIKQYKSIGTVQIAEITNRNRSSIHSDVTDMMKEGTIKRFQRGKFFYWEMV